MTKTFVLLSWHVSSSRTTVHDVMMMYCKERYMENVPKEVGRGKREKGMKREKL